MKITKELLEELKHEDVLTVKRQREILDEITDLVDKIWNHIIKVWGARLDWWAFSNDVELGSGNGSTGGIFNIETDEDWIEIVGDNNLWKFEDCPYNDGFPTELLFDENWKDTIFLKHEQWKFELEEKKKKEQEKKQNRLKKKKDVLNNIKNKLSDEELKFLKLSR